METPDPSRDRPALVAAGIVMALIGAWTLLQAYDIWAFTTDDAFITLRYARNWVLGHGINWNVDDPVPVEGYSNFSYLVLAALGLTLGAEPLAVLKVTGLLAQMGIYALLYVLARRWVRPVSATIPAFVFAAYPGTIFWAVSGLETALYTLTVLATLVVFVGALGGRTTPAEHSPTTRELSRRGLLGSGVIAALAALTRPEGPIVFVALNAALLAHFAVQSGTWRERAGEGRAAFAALGVGFAVPYGVYFAWRWQYFGRLLPNSVYCKVGYEGDPYVLLAWFALLAAPYVPLALYASWRRFDARYVALWVVPCLYAVGLIGADPILGYYGRHVQAAWAPLLVLSAVGLSTLITRVMRARPLLCDVMALGLVVGWVSLVGVGPAEAPLGPLTDGYARRSKARTELGHWLSSKLKPEDRYLIGDCGLVPYVASGHAIDAFCLNNRAMTEPPISGSVERFIDALVADPPAVIVVHSSEPDRLVPRPEYGFYPRLLRRQALAQQYVLLAKFGASGDEFHYWVLGLRTAMMRE